MLTEFNTNSGCHKDWDDHLSEENIDHTDYLLPVSATIKHNTSRKLVCARLWPLTIHHRSRTLRRIYNYILLFLLTFCSASLLNAWNASYSSPPHHYETLRQYASATNHSGRGNPNGEKVFIAANIIDANLIRGVWGSSLLELVDLLGDENVFISIYENDSGHETRSALTHLGSKLSANSSIVTGTHLNIDNVQRFMLPNGQERISRIDYLATVRNQLLKPLDSTYKTNHETGFVSVADTAFDRVLFLNDVYFDPVESIQLLFSTNVRNGKAEYRAACALDFIRGGQMYDTFVLRDTEGHSSGLMVYPWFAPYGESISRDAVIAQSDAVPVRSCWGGMVAFDGAIFQTRDASSIFTDDIDYDLLHFRSTREPFWESAECCLIFADMENRFGSPNITEGTGVFLNPYIRTAYSQTTWNWLPYLRRIERIFQYTQYFISKMLYPSYNPRRLHELGDLVTEDVWQQNTTLAGKFLSIERHAGMGGFCGQRQMMVLKNDFANRTHEGKCWEKIEPPS